MTRFDGALNRTPMGEDPTHHEFDDLTRRRGLRNVARIRAQLAEQAYRRTYRLDREEGTADVQAEPDADRPPPKVRRTARKGKAT